MWKPTNDGQIASDLPVGLAKQSNKQPAFLPNVWVQSWRMTRRDWRAGELRLLALALIIAVAAVCSVAFLVDRLNSGLRRDATQLLGADVVIQGDQPLTTEWISQATSNGLSYAQTASFPSMAIAADKPDRSILSAVKAVSDGYPLRGAIRLQRTSVTAGEVTDEPVKEIPQRGTVWVDAAVLQSLNLTVGNDLTLGDRRFRIARVISVEPDRGAAFANFAPRVMLNLDDLAATGLVQPGSRISYRVLVAGDRGAVERYKSYAIEKIQRGQQIESLEGGRPEVQRTLERAQRFLSLVALLAAMIAAVAVAVAARRFSLRHMDTCAMMRCLGLNQREIFSVFALEFLWVGIAACGVGVLFGLLFHSVLLSALKSFITTALPFPSLAPALQGFACGMLLLLGFALPPLAQLRRISPLRVLRRDVGAPSGRVALGYLFGIAGFIGLLLWTSGDLKVGALTAAGFVLGIAVFSAVAFAALRALRGLRKMTGNLDVGWRFALAGIQRRPVAAVVQLVALAVGLMALLLLTVIRTDLVGAWRKAAPADAPNRFVINIQPEQVTTIAARLKAAGVEGAPILPMVRGRLLAINGREVTPETYSNERAKRLVDREFNISSSTTAPDYNLIVAGKWFSPGERALSIEQGIAETLGVNLGDLLTFDIAGRTVEATASSFRKVNWDSMRANFFVIVPPELLEGAPASFISAFHLGEANANAGSALVREFPNLTVVDTSAVFKQVQAILDQVVAAVEFLFLFTLAAGVVVLYAALVSSHDERVREAALLRALGASRRQLARVQTVELLCLGALAGSLAACGAAAVGWTLAKFAFEFDYVVTPWVFLLGITSGIICALVGGWPGLRKVLNTAPLTSLREA